MIRNLTKSVFILFLSVTILVLGCTSKTEQINDQFTYVKKRSDDLSFSIYITAHAIRDLLKDETGRREALSVFRCNGITKAYIEVYRSGLVIDQSLLKEVRDFFLENNIDVVGGIATVPGDNFGVKQEGKLGWFNWQDPKTQEDLRQVMRMSAAVFDEFIVDDFLCTGDTSLISKEAKGTRSWSQYRMDLLTKLSEEIFIKPAKEVNPDITMIIKYPQWYDRFHLFGYDVEREPTLFDKVWVGTETRGQYTQRYGFVQPYEGFVNYKWIGDLAGAKLSGAWFDHGDCDKDDFFEQAWQSVLAGAKEIVFFNYYSFVNGHPAHHLVRTHFEQLADLAKHVSENPVKGIAAYKPPASDAGGDLYLMDFVGMLGIPLIPHAYYPVNAKVILLPTQAAKDPDVEVRIENSLKQGTTLIFTSGFLANVRNGEKLAEIAGIKYPLVVEPGKAEQIIVEEKSIEIPGGIDYESMLECTTGKVLLNAVRGKHHIPFFVEAFPAEGKVYTLNSHTFSQQDFDSVGEVLLCPKPLGLMEIPDEWVNLLRNRIINSLDFELYASTRICIQPMKDNSWVIHNYNKENKEVIFKSNDLEKAEYVNGFSGNQIISEGNSLKLNIPARSRIWIKRISNN